MLLVLSPAKKLDAETPSHVSDYSSPQLLEQAMELARTGRAMPVHEIKALMGLSDALAEKTAERFKAFSPPFTLANAKQAIFMFRGDVYQGLEADTLSEQDLAFAQNHVRILSGLYGVLKPLDLVQAYRLEMGRKFKTAKAADLYGFWDRTISEMLNAEAHLDGVLLNLASHEYFKAVQTKSLNARIITPVFKELRDGKLVQISFFAKRARGLMARYIIDERIMDEKAVQGFNREGYAYRPDLSTQTQWLFTRPDSRA